MIVREAYRDCTVRICHDHYNDRRPMPVGSPALGEVQDARDTGCEFCEMTEQLDRDAEEESRVDAAEYERLRG